MAANTDQLDDDIKTAAATVRALTDTDHDKYAMQEETTMDGEDVLNDDEAGKNHTKTNNPSKKRQRDKELTLSDRKDIFFRLDDMRQRSLTGKLPLGAFKNVAEQLSVKRRTVSQVWKSVSARVYEYYLLEQKEKPDNHDTVGSDNDDDDDEDDEGTPRYADLPDEVFANNRANCGSKRKYDRYELLALMEQSSATIVADGAEANYDSDTDDGGEEEDVYDKKENSSTSTEDKKRREKPSLRALESALGIARMTLRRAQQDRDVAAAKERAEYKEEGAYSTMLPLYEETSKRVITEKQFQIFQDGMFDLFKKVAAAGDDSSSS